MCQLEASDSLGNGPMKAPFSCPNNSDSSSPAGWQPVSQTYAARRYSAKIPPLGHWLAVRHARAVAKHRIYQSRLDGIACALSPAD